MQDITEAIHNALFAVCIIAMQHSSQGVICVPEQYLLKIATLDIAL